MEDYIRVYENVITPDFAKQLIAMFEENPEQHETIQLGDHRSFKQVTLQNHKDWEPFVAPFQNVFYEYIENYMSDCNITPKMFPQQFAFEQFRLKRYLPNGEDHFDDHVDVGDINSARRFLVFFLYLDHNEGGHTDFPEGNISVQPQTGRMLMFPPMWT